MLVECFVSRLFRAVAKAAPGGIELGAVGSRLFRAVVSARPTETRSSPKATNLTTQWLQPRYATLYRDLVRDLASRLRRSNVLGTVEDHVSDFLTKIIAKDTLAPVLAQGLSVKASVLKIWCYQHAVTQIRGWGTDAAMRTIRNARTTRENHDPDTVPVASSEPMRLTYADTSGGHDVQREWFDPAATGLDDDYGFRQLASKGRSAISDHLTREHVELWDELIAGAPRKDLREIHGHSLTPLLGEIQRVLKKSGVTAIHRDGY